MEGIYCIFIAFEWDGVFGSTQSSCLAVCTIALFSIF